MGAAYCASAEIAYSSLNTIRVRNLADKGDKRAKRALYISDNFDKSLTTLLIGNNITHIAFASVVTLMVTRVWGTSYVKYGTLVSTLVVFLFSEMIPKSYGNSNLKYALRISGSLKGLIKIFTPLSFLFTKIADAITRLFKVRDDSGMSEEDFQDIMRAVEEEKVLDEGKQNLLGSALNFDVIRVGDIFTPLMDVASIDIDAEGEDKLALIKEEKFSRFPVYSGEKDKIIGLLQTKKFLRTYIKKDYTGVSSLMIKPSYVTTDVFVDDLLRQMSRTKSHLYFVKDEKGKVIGIITLEDILEELVGEIWDESDLVEGADLG